VDCHDGAGEQLVADLTSSGVNADGTLREADYGHVAREILTVADEYDPRILVIGASSRTDVPLVPFGSVAHRLLHLSRRPLLIVPRQAGAAEAPQTAETAAAAATS
jgi:nucleotide-binding universal stress UspA family protein